MSPVLLLSVAFGAATLAGQRNAPVPTVGKEHIETAGMYAFQPPRGWIMSRQPPPGFKYRMAAGKLSNGAMASMMFADESQWRSLDDHIRAVITVLEREKLAKFTAFGGFETTSATPARRAVGEGVDDEGQPTRIVVYLFQGPVRIRVSATCTARIDRKDGDLLIDLRDASMKTFRFVGR